MVEATNPQSPCVSFLKERESDCLHCAIRASALFAELGKSDLDQRLKTIHNGVVPAETAIYRSGDPAEAVFTIRSGMVKLVGAAAVPSPRIVRLLGPGAAIGLEAATGGSYEHDAVAMRDVNLCRIPRSALLSLGQQHPGVQTGLVNKWREHALLADRWISTICNGKQKARATALVRLLIEISRDPWDAVRLPRTADMAAVLGCSAEGISRQMARLKRQGLLKRVAPRTFWCDPALTADLVDRA